MLPSAWSPSDPSCGALRSTPNANQPAARLGRPAGAIGPKMLRWQLRRFGSIVLPEEPPVIPADRALEIAIGPRVKPGGGASKQLSLASDQVQAAVKTAVSASRFCQQAFPAPFFCAWPHNRVVD